MNSYFVVQRRSAEMSAGEQKIKRDESFMEYYQMGTNATEWGLCSLRHLNDLDVLDKCSALSL